MEQELVRDDKLYDWAVYLSIPIQYSFLIWFVIMIPDVALFSTEFWGKTLSFGLLCGVIGINVAHELGHRKEKTDKVLSKILLLSSLYMHFFIEHNYGHHKHVATRKDPATARYNEPIYWFWIRSVLFSYISAWRIENSRLKKKGHSILGWKNEMIRFTVFQTAFVLLIFWLGGNQAGWAFVIAAFFGILLLETVNYIEHYGLQRNQLNANRYQDVEITHSWNSDHVVGRTILFELTRHSDHHANPHKKYQILEHADQSPQLPTGYPGMMLVAVLPPLWFLIMNPILKRKRAKEKAL